MTDKIKIALLYGGNSSEHEVSQQTAASIFQQLDRKKYNVSPIAIDKNGALYLHQSEDVQTHTKALPIRLDSETPISGLLRDGRFIIETDCVFPATHGPLYEDGCLQGILESANVAFVGSPVLSSAMGMNKDISRRMVCNHGIESAPYCVMDWSLSQERLQRRLENFTTTASFPFFVKPCSSGSSVGIQKVHNTQECCDAIKNALKYDDCVLVEEGINGREIELAVLENIDPNQAPLCSAAGEIKVHHPDAFYSYDAKYINTNSTELLIPAPLTTQTLRALQDQAQRIFTQLQCRGLARVDFFYDEKKDRIYFNEINTMPGFTTISMYPKLWEYNGLAYPKLLDGLIELALARRLRKTQRITSYQ